MNWKRFTEEERSEIRKSIISVGRTEAAKLFGIGRNRTYKFVSISEFRREKEKINLFKNMCIVCGGKRTYRLFCKLHQYRYITDPKKERQARKLAILQKYGLK